MRKLIVVLGGFAVILGCKNATSDSGYHLPPKEMQQVLQDVNIAESYSTIVKDNVHMQGTKNFDSLTVYYKAIFEHYNITAEQFTQSLEWYKSHADKLDTMYSNMIPRITAMQTRVSPYKPIQPPPPDSATIARIRSLERTNGMLKLPLKPGNNKDSAKKK